MSYHTIMVIGFIKIFFVQFFCVFLSPLLNIFCFCYVHTISVLYCAHLCLKCSLGISNLELTPKKNVLFIIGDWNAKVGSQETPGVTGKFGLGMWNEVGQRLIEFCQENALVIANTLF